MSYHSKKDKGNYDALIMTFFLLIGLVASFHSMYTVCFLIAAFLPSMSCLIIDYTKNKSITQIVLCFNVLSVLPYLQPMQTADGFNKTILIPLITLETFIKIYTIATSGAVIYAVTIFIYKAVMKYQLLKEESITKKAINKLKNEWRI